MEVRESFIVEAGHDDAAGFRAAKLLLAQKPRPDAIFCFNDPVAVGALRAVREAGLSVPEDVGLVGVANMHYSDVLAVPLTTVDQGTTAMGHQAAHRLLECMEAKRALPSEEVLIEPHLIVRASSARRR
jgi:LacI family transcriptional regulator